MVFVKTSAHFRPTPFPDFPTLARGSERVHNNVFSYPPLTTVILEYRYEDPSTRVQHSSHKVQEKPSICIVGGKIASAVQFETVGTEKPVFLYRGAVVTGHSTTGRN